MNQVSSFVKYNRHKLSLTQEELAEKSGVGLRFIRELEQGKQTLRMDKVNQVFQLFGYILTPGSARLIDPYDILVNHFKRNVRIQLKNRTELIGFIIEPVTGPHLISAWKFVSYNKVFEYQKTKHPDMEQIIEHSEIKQIDNL